MAIPLPLALIAAAEYVVSACTGILIAIGIMETLEDTATNDEIDWDKVTTSTEVQTAIEKARAKAHAKTQEIKVANNHCRQCPGTAGFLKMINRNPAQEVSRLYQMKITGLPSEPGWSMEYIFVGVEFDGFKPERCTFLEAKAAYDQFFKNNQPVDWFKGHDSILVQAATQNIIITKTAPNLLEWYWAEPISYRFYSTLFAKMKFVMTSIYVPL